MRVFTLIGAALLALAGAAPAAAQTVVDVPAFDSLQLRGGGRVVLRHGPRQRVTLLSGNLQTTRFRVDGDGRLVVDACVRTCRGYALRVEIVTPDIDAVAINGGGAITAERGFSHSGALAAAVHGGGAIDIRAIEAGDVAAAVSGGGSIRTHARRSLAASVNGGGSVTYWGDPHVTSSINGGGSVSPGGGR